MSGSHCMPERLSNEELPKTPRRAMGEPTYESGARSRVTSPQGHAAGMALEGLGKFDVVLRAARGRRLRFCFCPLGRRIAADRGRDRLGRTAFCDGGRTESELDARASQWRA